MGGLWKRMPFAFWVMLTGVLSICGVPGFSGFFSKDRVIYGMLQHGHPWLYAVGIVTAGITAYYMFRLLFVAFLGEYRGENGHEAAPRARSGVDHERAGRHTRRSERRDRRSADVRRRELALGALFRAAVRSERRRGERRYPRDLRDGYVGDRLRFRVVRIRNRVDALRDARRPGERGGAAADGDPAHAGAPHEQLLFRRGDRPDFRASGAVVRQRLRDACSTRT